MHRARHSWLTAAAVTAGLALLCAFNSSQPNPSLGQEKTPEAKKAKPKSADPEYPHVTLATSYKVDPAWPVRPKHVEWGHMPGVAVDAHDNVWLFTRAKPPVQAYGPDGKYIMGWGDKEIGKAHHIKFDGDGNIWVADIDLHVVMQFTPQGKLLKTLGTRARAGKDETHLNMPTDMAITPGGDVFVSDGYGNARIVHFDKDGKFVKAWGKLGSKPGEFSIPHAIVVDSKGRLYVADRNNVRVQVFDQEGKLLDVWSDVVTPWGFWITKNDDIWVCGSSPMPWRSEDEALGCPPKDQVFMRFDTAGRMRQLWTIPKAEDGKEKPGELNWVHGMALDSKGNIYAGDIIGQRAQKFVRQAPK
jgi:hypothetical protein